VSLVEWLRRRVVERRTHSGASVGWSTFERDRPALAQAAMRFLHQFQLDLPRGVRLTERYRQPLAAEDWVALIEDFSMGFLKTSPEERDHRDAWDEVHAGLRSLGYTLTVRGVRSSVTPIDRVLALSASKAVATTEILRIESQVLGDRLRALVLCDFERATSEVNVALRDVLDPQAGSARLVLESLVQDTAAADLQPTLVTARSVAASRATAASLRTWLAQESPDLAAALQTDETTSGEWDDVVSIAPDHPMWRPRTYVPLLTRAFETGVVRCLVGTRALLGEGWDAQRVNVLVDLTSAGTTVAVHQMRGRTLRLDPNLPRKVADNWDVVCVAPDHPRGANDYVRFVRKHTQYFAPTTEGEIESGVSHVHHALSPFGPPGVGTFGEVNSTMLTRAEDREGAYQRWAIGTPYDNAQIDTVRVRFGKPLGLPGQDLTRHAADPTKPPSNEVRRHLLRVAAAGAGAGVFGVMVGQSLAIEPALPALVAVAATFAGGIGLTGRMLRRSLGELKPSDALEDLAAAVADGLRDAGGLRPELGRQDVRVVLQDDGYYRCYLSHATREESVLFAESMDELLAPLASPRYIIGRYVASDVPAGPFGAFGLALRFTLQHRVSNRVVYHAVPAYLAANKTRVQAFERAWQKYVSPTSALYYQDPKAAGILAVETGANPFEATSQLRTLWQ
jgi:hypothetical protein